MPCTNPIQYPVPQADIFCFPHAYSADESAEIFKLLKTDLDWQQAHITLHGRTVPIPRLQQWYGDSAYNYSRLHMPARPMMPLLSRLKDRAEQLTRFTYNSALCNLYRHERDSVAWHADDEAELGANPAIASLSFGGDRIFQFKPKSGVTLPFNINLQAGNLLLMKGETQHHWLHQIPKTNKPTGERICLTFRMTCPGLSEILVS